MRTRLARLLIAVLLGFPLTVAAGEKQIVDVKELAGSWRGFVTTGSQPYATMLIREDGSYQASTREPGGTLTVGQFFLQDGKLRYRSSRTSGTAIVSEDKGKTFLTIVPEDPSNETGKAEYERLK
jgi:hypothetical protein